MSILEQTISLVKLAEATSLTEVTRRASQNRSMLFHSLSLLSKRGMVGKNGAGCFNGLGQT